MNVYFLVEGQSTEADVYPIWLSYLIPELSRVEFFDEIETNNYYLFSSYGIPHIENDIVNAIKDINSVGKYKYLVICLDDDAATVSQRETKIQNILISESLELSASLKIIVQNRCIETWFLGNRKIYTRNPQNNPNFIKYSSYYNVCRNDPELMEKPSTHEGSIADFHVAYLRSMFLERGNMRYSKNNSKEIQKKSYLEELQNRVIDCPEHLKSFLNFIDICAEIREELLSK